MTPEERDRLMAVGFDTLAGLADNEQRLIQEVPALADRVHWISMVATSEIVKLLLRHRRPR